MVTRCLTSTTADCSMTNFSINLFIHTKIQNSPSRFWNIWRAAVNLSIYFSSSIPISNFDFNFRTVEHTAAITASLNHLLVKLLISYIFLTLMCLCVDIFHGSVDEFLLFMAFTPEIFGSMSFSLSLFEWRQFIYVLRRRKSREMCVTSTLISFLLFDYQMCHVLSMSLFRCELKFE